MSREIYLDIKRKRVLERAKQLRVEPKLSPEVEAELKELFQMEKLEKAIKKRPSHTWIRNNLDKAEEIDWAFVKIEKEFVAFKKDYATKIHVSRKKLEDFDVFEWLKENHCDKERFAVLGANLIETLQLFIKKEFLGWKNEFLL